MYLSVFVSAFTEYVKKVAKRKLCLLSFRIHHNSCLWNDDVHLSCETSMDDNLASAYWK